MNPELEFSQKRYGVAAVSQEILNKAPEYQEFLKEHVFGPKLAALEHQRAEHNAAVANTRKKIREFEATIAELQANGYEPEDRRMIEAQAGLSHWGDVLALQTGVVGVAFMDEIANTKQAIADCDKRIKKIKHEREIAAREAKEAGGKP